MKSPHIPVLLNEVIESFEDLKEKEGYFVDCTLGYAGHSQAILENFPKIKHIGIDRDKEAIEFSSNRLKDFKDKSTLYYGSFSSIFKELKEEPIIAILADFGLSSLQLDKRSRGFSFTSETLDMRMDSSSDLSAYEVVNNYSQERLMKILKEYGDIRNAKEIASLIVKNRPIKSAKELSSILPSFKSKIHPATLIFQAIRIEVNSELKEIEGLLETIEKKRPKEAIISCISFHSLEDRIVKNYFNKWSKNCICPPNAIRCTCGNNHSLGKPINKKPIVADKKELKENPRSRSAKLRSFKFKNSF